MQAEEGGERIRKRRGGCDESSEGPEDERAGVENGGWVEDPW